MHLNLDAKANAKENPKSVSQDIAILDNNLSMFAASIEATAQDGGGGILGDKKIRIINLGPVINHDKVDYAPTISADGKTLYYVSNKEGSIVNENGNLSHDFWVAKKDNRLDTVFQKLPESHFIPLMLINVRNA